MVISSFSSKKVKYNEGKNRRGHSKEREFETPTITRDENEPSQVKLY